VPKILITGANSFVGRNFIKHSQFKDIDEVSLLKAKPETIDFGRYDVVLHLAAIVHRSDKIPADKYFQVNRDLCLSVAKVAKSSGVKHFIFLSSSNVYGNQNSDTVFTEDSLCNPEDPYGKSKYEAELLLNKLGSSDFTISIIRTPIVYGEGVKANMLNIIRLIDTFPVLPFKGIINKRSITFVENLVSMIDKIIETRSSGTFLITDDKPLSTTELVKYISKYLGKKILLFKLPGFIVSALTCISPRKMNSLFGSSILDNSKSRRDLNFNPPVSTEEGIKRMVLHYNAMKSAGN